jgi:hypothetical protein
MSKIHLGRDLSQNVWLSLSVVSYVTTIWLDFLPSLKRLVVKYFDTVIVERTTGLLIWRSGHRLR